MVRQAALEYMELLWGPSALLEFALTWKSAATGSRVLEEDVIKALLTQEWVGVRKSNKRSYNTLGLGSGYSL